MVSTGSKTWNAKLTKALLSFRFQQSQHDHSLFVKKETEGVAMVLVYVNDMLIAGDSLKLIQHTKATLQETFKMKDLEELKYFLGIEFARSEKETIMYQRKYTLQLISETGLRAGKPAMTPIDTNIKLTSREYDDHLLEGNEHTEAWADQSCYQKLIGKLLYLTMARPDISYCIQTLSQFLQAPT